MSADTTRVKQEVSSKDVQWWVTLGKSYVTAYYSYCFGIPPRNDAFFSLVPTALPGNVRSSILFKVYQQIQQGKSSLTFAFLSLKFWLFPIRDAKMIADLPEILSQ